MSVIIGRSHQTLRNLKEAILIFCLIYFYALAFALQIGRPTYHADHPFVFIGVFGIFLSAIFLEVILEWQQKSEVLLWGGMFAASYGIIGIYVVPQIFGVEILKYILLEPLVIVFLGGFVYAYANVFTRALFFSPRISKKEWDQALDVLPGWSMNNFFEKTFQFEDFHQALNFVNRAANQLAGDTNAPGFIIQFGKVIVRFRPHPLRGLSHTQLELAKRIEHLT